MVTATRSNREGVNEQDKQVVLFSFSVDLHHQTGF